MSSDHQNGKTWQLSLYEAQRKPQELVLNNEEIAVSPRSLHSELMCPICLDMLKNTMTTKECLHRFCQDCIITALRNGNKECPTCRKKLVSKRALRPDPNFDELISKIYPNREDYDAQQERTLAKINKRNFDDCDTENKKKHGADNGEDMETDQSFKDAKSIQDVELIFRPLKLSNKDEVGDLSEFLTVRYLKTSNSATVEHLVKYISLRHILDTKRSNPQNSSEQMKADANNEESLFTIYQAGGPGEFKPLSGNVSLKQIASEKYDGDYDRYRKTGAPLELHYAFRSNLI